MQFDPSRRLFLRNAGLAAVAPIVIPPAIGPIEKIVKYFFAPAGGWTSPAVVTGNTLLTPVIITREALMILRANLKFNNINKQFDDDFNAARKIGSRISVRIPQHFIVN